MAAKRAPDADGAVAMQDGRVQRGARNREAILDACLELIRERAALPTAQDVAVRAGVQVRTVFRHFDDMAAAPRIGSTSES